MNDASQTPLSPPPFEQALHRLEQIVEALENDPPDLETALTQYEEGVRLAQLCMDRLNTAELRIQELSIE
jgi:exodeoxyribonuclease VII small subunit